MKRDRAYHREKAAEFLAKLTREQKLLVINGTAEERVAAGLPRLEEYGEAAHGVQARHDQTFDLGEPVFTTVFQNPVGFAATFDKELMREIGDLTGVEARSLYKEKKHRALCMLAPTVDMERDPRWGRNEEAYGEDPHLTSRIAGEYILGMAGEDPRYVRCGATLKHFYGNNVENDRNLADSNISDYLKDNYYVQVFEEVIDYADPLSVMASYNYVNGVPQTFTPEITTRLKDRGLPFVTGDGGAISMGVIRQKEAESFTDSLVRAIGVGMDAFPEEHAVVRKGLAEALDLGKLSEEAFDRVVLNRLTAYSLLGLLPEDEGVEEAFPDSVYNLSRVDSPEGRALARRASAEAVVLLKNEKRALPLREEERVLLLGPFADRCPMDWYSGITSHQVTLREGLGAAAAGCEALYPYVRIRMSDGGYAGLDGQKVISVDQEHAEVFRIMLWDDSRFTLRATSNGKILTTHKPGQRVINSEEPEDFHLYASAEDVFSWFAKEAFQMIDAAGKAICFTEENALHFWEDERIAGISNFDGSIRLSFETVETAEELLRKTRGVPADRVIAVFGLHPIVNGKEERDRTTIQLPPFQRVLLRMIRKQYVQVELVLHTNSPVAIVEETEDPVVTSITWMATGSEEYGNSLADVLFGRVSPAGRLCQTWYQSDDQLPEITDYDIKKNKITYIYMEEEPLFRFGFGLSYATFDQEITAQSGGKTVMEAGKTADYEAGHVTVRVKNTGSVVSDEVVQVYRKPEGGYRLFEDKTLPGCRLAAFTRLHDMEPGEERSVDLVCRY